MIGCGLAAASVYLAAAGVAQPEQPGLAEAEGPDPVPGLEGWGKLTEPTSQDVGVWAVEGPSALRVMSDGSDSTAGTRSDRFASRPIEALSVVVQGKAHDVLTNAATVGQLLSAMRIGPDGNDVVVPPPSAPITNVSRVSFSQVVIRTISEVDHVRAGPQRIATPRLPDGVTQPLTAGRVGQVLRTYRVRFVNGRPVSRKLVSSRLLRTPVPGMERVGTASGTLTGEASWYYVNDYYNAASPWIPKGTEVTVTNLDTGASVTVVINDRGPFGGRIIDLSEFAFRKIAPLSQGVAYVRITW